MKKQYYFILPLLLLICFAVLGQNPNIRFYGFPGENSYASTMKQLSNGNLALTYSNSCYSSDGSFPIEGCPLGSGIRLVSASGDTLWKKQLDSGYGRFPNDIMEDANGNITAIWVKGGITASCFGIIVGGAFGGGAKVPHAFYLDTNGTLLSDTSFPPQDCSMEYQFTCQLADGKKMLFTNYDQLVLTNPPLITIKYTLNPDNSVLSTNAAVTNDFHSGTVVPTPDNTFMVTWRDDNNKFFVSEMNTNGDFLWSKAADSLNAKVVHSLKICLNGDLLVLQGRKSNQLTNNVFLTRLDADGNFLWQKSYDGRWFDMSMDVRSDNSILIASAKPLQYPDESELEVRLLNADGEIIEDKVWNISPGGDHPRTILALPNGDYVVYGTAYLSNLDSINGPVRAFLLTDHADFSGSVEAAATNPLSIWPNPVRDVIHLPTALTLTEAEITDGIGRSFGRRSIVSHQLSVSDLPAGVYVLRCFDTIDSRVWLSRFVKN